MLQNNHFMIDLETLGLKNDAVFLSIGCVRFEITSGHIIDTFYRTVTLKSAIAAGRTIDADTLQWWLTQKPEIMAKMFKGAEHLKDVLIQLYNFIALSEEPPIVWGNSAEFDLGKLKHAYDYFDMLPPWEFRKERCYRTFISELPNYEVEKMEGAHDPIVDCYYQIKKLVGTKNLIK